MSESQKKADKKYYEKMRLLGWFKKSFWMHGDDIKDIAAYIDSKADRRRLIDECKEK